jgi:hypothetical protein
MGEAGLGEELFALRQGSLRALLKAHGACGLGLTGILAGQVNGEPIDFPCRRVHLRSSLLTGPI